MKKELDQKEQVCSICKGNHYWVDEDYNVNQCPDCTIGEPMEVEHE